MGLICAASSELDEELLEVTLPLRTFMVAISSMGLGGPMWTVWISSGFAALGSLSELLLPEELFFFSDFFFLLIVIGSGFTISLATEVSPSELLEEELGDCLSLLSIFSLTDSRSGNSGALITDTNTDVGIFSSSEELLEEEELLLDELFSCLIIDGLDGFESFNLMAGFFTAEIVAIRIGVSSSELLEEVLDDLFIDFTSFSLNESTFGNLPFETVTTEISAGSSLSEELLEVEEPPLAACLFLIKFLDGIALSFLNGISGFLTIETVAKDIGVSLSELLEEELDDFLFDFSRFCLNDLTLDILGLSTVCSVTVVVTAMRSSSEELLEDEELELDEELLLDACLFLIKVLDGIALSFLNGISGLLTIETVAIEIGVSSLLDEQLDNRFFDLSSLSLNDLTLGNLIDETGATGIAFGISSNGWASEELLLLLDEEELLLELELRPRSVLINPGLSSLSSSGFSKGKGLFSIVTEVTRTASGLASLSEEVLDRLRKTGLLIFTLTASTIGFFEVEETVTGIRL
jgi:hypothetical protein